MTRLTKRGAALLAAGAVLGGAVSYAVVAPSAEAIPAAQETCKFDIKSISASDGWQPLGLSVTVNNGSVSRKVVTQLSADMGVDSQAEIRVGYKVDDGPIREKYYGPGNLANHTDFWQTRNAMAVMSLKSGKHTITPYWRISGSATSKGWLENGCFIAEGRTS
ncbi:MAG: hypothetical protein QM619_11720 [Micropruina sp.]|uniref:hypothetical protein n=1 Tax=Micropruina sp. TaxID=2737536 RepID=UPI0039E37821